MTCSLWLSNVPVPMGSVHKHKAMVITPGRTRNKEAQTHPSDPDPARTRCCQTGYPGDARGLGAHGPAAGRKLGSFPHPSHRRLFTALKASLVGSAHHQVLACESGAPVAAASSRGAPAICSRTPIPACAAAVG